MDEMSVRLDDGTDLKEDQKKKIRLVTRAAAVWVVSVCVGSAWKILLVIARSLW